MADLSRIPTEELLAIRNKDFSKVSTETLLSIRKDNLASPAPPRLSPQAQEPRPSMARRALAGFTRTPIPQPQGFDVGDIYEGIGAEALPTIGAGLAAPFGAVGGLPGMAVAGGIGASAGRSVQEVASQAISKFRPDLSKPRTVAESVGEAETTGVLEAGLGLGIPALGKTVRAGAKATTSFLAQGISQASKSGTARAFRRSAEVLSDFMRNPNTPKRLGLEFRGALEAEEKAAEAKYRTLINEAVENAFGTSKRFNLREEMAPVLKDVQEELGFGIENRFGGSSTKEKKLFNNLVEFVDNMDGVTADDIYVFQKDLNREIKKHVKEGNVEPIGIAYLKFKDGLQDFLGEQLPVIREANLAYKKGQDLNRSLKRVGFTNSFNPSKWVKRTLAADDDKADLIREVATEYPKVSEALERLQDAHAGAEFSAKFADVPRTGFLPGLGLLAGAGFHITRSPFILAAGMVAAPFLSPRIAGGIIKHQVSLGKAAGKLSSAVPAVRPIMEELQRRFSAGVNGSNNPQ